MLRKNVSSWAVVGLGPFSSRRFKAVWIVLSFAFMAAGRSLRGATRSPSHLLKSFRSLDSIFWSVPDHVKNCRKSIERKALVPLLTPYLRTIPSAITCEPPRVVFCGGALNQQIGVPRLGVIVGATRQPSHRQSVSTNLTINAFF